MKDKVTEWVLSIYDMQREEAEVVAEKLIAEDREGLLSLFKEEDDSISQLKEMLDELEESYYQAFPKPLPVKTSPIETLEDFPPERNYFKGLGKKQLQVLKELSEEPKGVQIDKYPQTFHRLAFPRGLCECRITRIKQGTRARWGYDVLITERGKRALEYYKKLKEKDQVESLSS